MDTILRDQRRSWEIGATLFVAFGGLALVVAAIGLYAVIGYNVSQRMHELGVRIALGARSPDVVRLVVGQGMGFAIAGAALGSALAWMAARWVEPLLFEQSARDPVVFVSVGRHPGHGGGACQLGAGIPRHSRRPEPDFEGRIDATGGRRNPSVPYRV
jgi:hypothetical protein